MVGSLAAAAPRAWQQLLPVPLPAAASHASASARLLLLLLPVGVSCWLLGSEAPAGCCAAAELAAGLVMVMAAVPSIPAATAVFSRAVLDIERRRQQNHGHCLVTQIPCQKAEMPSSFRRLFRGWGCKMLQTYVVMFPCIFTLQDASPVGGWQLHLFCLYSNSSSLLLIGSKRRTTCAKKLWPRVAAVCWFLASVGWKCGSVHCWQQHLCYLLT
jgi:hypothetical protein